MKVAYFGFDLFYECLEQIKQSGHEIIKIFTCKVDEVYEFSDKVRAFAFRNNISITDDKVCREDVLELIKNDCDLLFSAGYYFKIPVVDDILGVNVHPALLPVGRGPWPQPVTLLKGLRESGVTLHKLSDKFDEGEIIIQKKFNVDHDENLETLTQKYAYYAKIATRELFDSFDEFISKSIKQNSGEYWPEPNDDDMTFSENDCADKINRILHAFYGYKCVMITKEGTINIKKGHFRNKLDKSCTSYKSYKVKDGFVVVFEYA